MSVKDKEFKAFHTAKLHVSEPKRQDALNKISRRGLLMRLVLESDFPDTRLGAMRKLDMLAHRKESPQEYAFYLQRALKEKMTEIRSIAAKRVHPSDRDKLTTSNFADVRLMVAQMTSSRDTLFRLLIDRNKEVREMAEKGLRKNGLQASSRPHSVN